MIGHAFFYGAALVCNCVFVSGTIFSAFKVDPSSMNLYKSGVRGSNDFEYSLSKRGSQDAQDSPDSKERRSQMGSSFIRFGRSRFEGNLENSDYSSGNELDSMSAPGSPSSSRITRGRGDVIIRFGRSDAKNLRAAQLQQSRGGETKFIRFGNKPTEVNDLEQLAVVCSNVLASSSDAPGNQLGLYLPKLARLCNSLGIGIVDDNNEIRRKSKMIEFLEDASQTENLKHE